MEDRLYLSQTSDRLSILGEKGARYDRDRSRWYIRPDDDRALFEQWIPVRLRCPFSEKGRVKALGAYWDTHERSWFAPNNHNVLRFKRWLCRGQEPNGGFVRVAVPVGREERKEEEEQQNMYVAREVAAGVVSEEESEFEPYLQQQQETEDSEIENDALDSLDDEEEVVLLRPVPVDRRQVHQIEEDSDTDGRSDDDGVLILDNSGGESEHNNLSSMDDELSEDDDFHMVFDHENVEFFSDEDLNEDLDENEPEEGRFVLDQVVVRAGGRDVVAFDRHDHRKRARAEEQKEVAPTADELPIPGVTYPECVICMMPRVQSCALNCGHQYCRACATKLKKEQNKCAVCRKTITLVIPLFG